MRNVNLHLSLNFRPSPSPPAPCPLPLRGHTQIRTLSVCVFVLVLVCVCVPVPVFAQSLATDAAHEVKRVPAPPYPVRGPRFSAVTLDLYFSFGHGPSQVGAELARRAVENARAKDVREVLRLAPVGVDLPLKEVYDRVDFSAKDESRGDTETPHP